MIIAEELGVTSANVDEMTSSNVPEVLRLLGVEKQVAARSSTTTSFKALR
jgi:hypothetical protein